MRYTFLAPFLLAAPLLGACGGTGAAPAAVVAPTAAAPAREVAARRAQAIAGNDVTGAMADYAPDAVLHWVGGPLDGTYAGTERIESVWTRFAAAQGPMRLDTVAATFSANPRGATLAADATFTGAAAVKVRHVQTIRDGRVVNEVWQVDPGRPD